MTKLHARLHLTIMGPDLAWEVRSSNLGNRIYSSFSRALIKEDWMNLDIFTKVWAKGITSHRYRTFGGSPPDMKALRAATCNKIVYSCRASTD